MKSNYSFENRQNYLYMTISGMYEKTEFLSYPKIIKAECEKENIYNVLINALDLIGSDPPMMDRFFLGEEIANSLGPLIRVAVVWPEKDIDKFAETVAVNRGGNVRVLGNAASAKEWLLMNDK